MPTSAQIEANRRNSQLSSGPKTEAGKAAAARNNLRHGLAGAFREEHQPATTETALAEGMAQHQWLRKCALRLESFCFDAITGQIEDEKQLALCLRYQTTYERGFHKCLNALLKLRAEKRKAKIGFESQKREKAERTRKQEKHEMAKERHKWDVLLTEAKVDH
jgi:hypothetical protein